MPKQNKLSCSLLPAGGWGAKMSVLEAGRHPGILPVLPGHPPFPCLQHHPQPSQPLHAHAPHSFPPFLGRYPQFLSLPDFLGQRGPLSPGLILTVLLWAEHLASECLEWLSVAVGGNSLAQENSSRGKEQVAVSPQDRCRPQCKQSQSWGEKHQI